MRKSPRKANTPPGWATSKAFAERKAQVKRRALVYLRRKGGALGAVAHAVGISESTLSRYLREDKAFGKSYRAVQKKVGYCPARRTTGKYKGKVLEAKKQALVASIRAGATYRDACKALKVGGGTYLQWRREDAEFAAALEAAEVDRVRVVEDVLFDKALEGDKTCLIFWLCNRAGGKWRSVLHAKVDTTVRQTAEALAGVPTQALVDILRKKERATADADDDGRA